MKKLTEEHSLVAHKLSMLENAGDWKKNSNNSG